MSCDADRMKNINTDYQTQYDQLIQAGTAQSTRRAYSRDTRYFFAWLKASLNQDEHYPVTVETVCRFILDHVNGLPTDVEQSLRHKKRKMTDGPLKISTIRRYLVSLSVAHAEHGVPSPTLDTRVKLLLRRAAAAKPHMPHQKSAITLDILKQLISMCDDSLRGRRDKAILLVGFASGGRRRSELSNMCIEDLEKVDEGYLMHIRQSKTDQEGQGHTVPVFGEAAVALSEWLVKSGIRAGYLFRGIKPNDSFFKKLSGHGINEMLKNRIKAIGLNKEAFGAHSLRAGFITEAGRNGFNLKDAMQLSGHANSEVARKYYRATQLLHNPSAKLI